MSAPRYSPLAFFGGCLCLILCLPAQGWASPSAMTALRIDGLAIVQGNVSFSLANAGIAPFLVRRVQITGTDEAGTPVFEHALPAQYTLAHGVRTYDLLLRASECLASNLVIAVETDKGSRTASIAPTDVSCSP
jgi:hypothetical protein